MIFQASTDLKMGISVFDTLKYFFEVAQIRYDDYHLRRSAVALLPFLLATMIVTIIAFLRFSQS
jgi:hypothetical protein